MIAALCEEFFSILFFYYKVVYHLPTSTGKTKNCSR